VKRLAEGRSRMAMALAVGSLVTGCASLFGESPPIAYYTLTPTSFSESTRLLTDNSIIAVQTVRLPEYLNQKGIVSRTEDNELDVAANSQWAGALDDNITKVIVADLSKLLGTTRILAYPVSAALPVDRVVQVDVSRFEAGSGGNVELSAQWIIFSDGGRRYMQMAGGNYSAPAGNGDFRSIAAAMSRALGDLSRDIAISLTPASTNRKASSS
jgi:uncharacterized protein